MIDVDAIEEYVDGGCCRSIEEVLEATGHDLESLSREDHERVEEIIFNCEECNWTMPVTEQSEFDITVCKEC